jgi:hypothetical protein
MNRIWPEGIVSGSKKISKVLCAMQTPELRSKKCAQRRMKKPQKREEYMGGGGWKVKHRPEASGRKTIG